MVSNSPDLKVVTKKNKLVIKYGKKTTSKNNLYVQTCGGKFTSPPANKYSQYTQLDSSKEYRISFQASSHNDVQKLSMFFMCYNDKERIFNKSVPLRLTKKTEDFSFQFKPPKDTAAFKIAFKVNRKQNKKEKIKIENLVMKSLI